MTQDISLAAAFGAGILSFFSPCVLPLVPAYIANLAGSAAIEAKTRKSFWPTLFHSLCFVAGFSIIFVALGASVGLIGTTLTMHSDIMRMIAGAFICLLGIFLIASYKLPWLNYEKRFHLSTERNPGYIRSVIMGAAFAIGWTPCVGPILGTILALAWNSQQVWEGAKLLIVYSMGMGIPFIIIGIAWGAIVPFWKSINRYTGIISIVSGALLIIIGILVFTGNLGLLGQFIPFEF